MPSHYGGVIYKAERTKVEYLALKPGYWKWRMNVVSLKTSIPNHWCKRSPGSWICKRSANLLLIIGYHLTASTKFLPLPCGLDVLVKDSQIWSLRCSPVSDWVFTYWIFVTADFYVPVIAVDLLNYLIIELHFGYSLCWVTSKHLADPYFYQVPDRCSPNTLYNQRCYTLHHNYRDICILESMLTSFWDAKVSRRF